MTDVNSKRVVVALVFVLLIAVSIFSLFRLTGKTDLNQIFSKKTADNTHNNVLSGAPDKSTLWERMNMARADGSVRAQVRGKYISWNGPELSIQMKDSVQTVQVRDQVQYECMPSSMSGPDGGSPVPLAEAYINFMDRDGMGRMTLSSEVKSSLVVGDEVIVLGLMSKGVVVGDTIITMKCGGR